MSGYEQFMKSKDVKRLRIFYWILVLGSSFLASWVLGPSVKEGQGWFVWITLSTFFLGITFLKSLCSLPVHRRLEKEIRFRQMLTLSPLVDATLRELYSYLEAAFDREVVLLQERAESRKCADPAAADDNSEEMHGLLWHAKRSVAERKARFWAFHALAKQLGYKVEATSAAYKTPVAEVAETDS